MAGCVFGKYCRAGDGNLHVDKVFPLPSGKANCKLPRDSGLRYHIAFWLHTNLGKFEHLIRIQQLKDL